MTYLEFPKISPSKFVLRRAEFAKISETALNILLTLHTVYYSKKHSQHWQFKKLKFWSIGKHWRWLVEVEISDFFTTQLCRVMFSRKLSCERACSVMLKTDTWEGTRRLERISTERHKQWEDALLCRATLHWSLLVFTGLHCLHFIERNTQGAKKTSPGILADSGHFCGLVAMFQSLAVSAGSCCCYRFVFSVCYWIGLPVSWQGRVESSQETTFKQVHNPIFLFTFFFLLSVG